jgi:serine/threonine-protein kinase SRPK3
MPALAGEDFDLPYIRGHFERYFTPEGGLFSSMIVFYRNRFSMGGLRIKVQNVGNMEQVLDVYGVFDDFEKPLFIDFLHSILRLKPSDRASAEELLEHEWVKKG